MVTFTWSRGAFSTSYLRKSDSHSQAGSTTFTWSLGACGSRYPRYLPGVEVPVAAVAGEALLVPHLALPGEHLHFGCICFSLFSTVRFQMCP